MSKEREERAVEASAEHARQRKLDRVRREEQELAQRRAQAVGPWDNGEPKWDPEWFGCRT